MEELLICHHRNEITGVEEINASREVLDRVYCGLIGVTRLSKFDQKHIQKIDKMIKNNEINIPLNELKILKKYLYFE